MKDKDKYALKETAKDVVKWLIVAVVGFALGWALGWATSLLKIGIIASLALIVVIPLLIGIAGTFIEHRDDYRP